MFIYTLAIPVMHFVSNPSAKHNLKNKAKNSQENIPHRKLQKIILVMSY
jgi:hypothetical protein